MIPISLRLKGIYSYQNEQVLNFDMLNQAKLFGIFGAVGSGKSTILEAICLSLYGIAERFDSKKPNIYNLMNLKSDNLFIEYIFGGYNNTQYKFVVDAKRSKKNFEKISSFNRSAYVYKGNEWTPLGKISAEDIIGLNYEHFKKTIIIPQGKFQDFLLMPDTERVKMLQEIFNLNKFDLFDKAASLENKVNDQKIHILGQLEQLKTVSQESFKNAKDEYESLSKELKTQNKFKNITEKKLEIFNDYKKNIMNLNEREEQLKLLVVKEMEYRKRQKDLSTYEECILNFKYLIQSSNETQNQINILKKEIIAKNQSLNTNNKLLVEGNDAFLSLKKDYQEKEKYLTKANEIKIISQINKLHLILNKFNENLNRKKLDINKIKSQLQECENQNNLIDYEIKQKTKCSKDIEKLFECQKWYLDYKTLKDSMDSEKKEDSELSNKQEKLREKLGSKLHVFNLKNKFKNIDDLVKRFEKLDRENSEQLDSLVNDLALSVNLKQLTNVFKKNKPCPLCGSLKHPQVLKVDSLNQCIKNSEMEQKNLLAKKKSLQYILAELFKIKVEFSNYDLKRKNVSKSIEEIKSKINNHLKIFVWKDFDPENSTEFYNEMHQVRVINKAIVELEKQKEILKREWNLLKLKLERENIILDNLYKEQIKYSSKCTTLTEQIKLLSIEKYKNKDELLLKTEESIFFSKYNNIENEYNNIQKKIESLHKTINNFTGQIESDQKKLNKLQKGLLDIQIELGEKVKQFKYPNQQFVIEVLNKEINISKEKEDIKVYYQKCDTIHIQIKELKELLSKINYNEKEHSELLIKMEDVKNKLDQKTQQKGALIEKIKELESQIKAKIILEKEYSNLQNKTQNIRTIKNLLSGKGFVKYVSRKYLKNLCRAANERFHKLTHNNLSLELTQNNDFQIKDYLNNGQTRSIRTLSGGQIFQVSFCLALALSDNIQKLTKCKENFFFMDEGFGSLDSNSLQLVFNTLKSLQKENRIIGVISHIESLQQEFDVYLKIALDSFSGSKIQTNWAS